MNVFVLKEIESSHIFFLSSSSQIYILYPKRVKEEREKEYLLHKKKTGNEKRDRKRGERDMRVKQITKGLRGYIFLLNYS